MLEGSYKAETFFSPPNSNFICSCVSCLNVADGCVSVLRRRPQSIVNRSTAVVAWKSTVRQARTSKDKPVEEKKEGKEGDLELAVCTVAAKGFKLFAPSEVAPVFLYYNRIEGR